MTRAYADPEALVDPGWVERHASDPDVRLVEVDVDTALYAKGHIPGAVGWSWTRDLNDPVARDVVSRDAFERLLSRSGIGNDTTVVLYGDHDNWFAAYGAWLLAYYGHERVKLLDGGRKAWVATRRPLVVDPPAERAATYRVARVREGLRARRDEVLAAARSGAPALVDVRSPDEFSGKILAPPGMGETALRGGHVPGARNVPWSAAVKEDGTYRDADALAAVYADALRAGGDVVTYCRIGERSSHTWFALHRLLGAPARNYDGSWTEYGNLVGAPIATGPEP